MTEINLTYFLTTKQAFYGFKKEKVHQAGNQGMHGCVRETLFGCLRERAVTKWLNRPDGQKEESAIGRFCLMRFLCVFGNDLHISYNQ